MGATGTAQVDFGSGNGATTASVAVTGQAGIVSGSALEAWLYPLATTDHTVDEHIVEEIRVYGASIIAATGFTIYARTTNLPLFGKWTCGWAWF